MQVRRTTPTDVAYLSLTRAARIIAQAWTHKVKGDAFEVAFEEAGELLQRRAVLTTGVARYELVACGSDAPCRNGVQGSLQDVSHAGSQPQEK